MADIELLIKIPEEIYESSKKECEENDSLIIDTFTYAIGNGTPLPKGHGDLIDGDALRKEILSWGMNDYEPSDFIDEIDMADVIIKADKEYEAEVITRGNCMICGKELTEGLFFCKECENKCKECENKANNGK